MRCLAVFFVCAAVFSVCQGRSVESHQSAVSVYTTQPTTSTSQCCSSIYKEIANNIAETVIHPIARFFDFSGPKPEPPLYKRKQTTLKATPKTIQKFTKTVTIRTTTETTTTQDDEYLDNKIKDASNSSGTEKSTDKNSTTEIITTKSWKNLELVTDSDLQPVNNVLSLERDVEDISVEKASKKDKKPEKYSLFTTNSPYTETLEKNETTEATDDLDYIILDEIPDKKKENAVVYFLEMIGSVFQLAWGAFLAIFKPKSGS